MSAVPAPASAEQNSAVVTTGFNSMVSAAVGKLKETAAAVLKQQKPWSEVLDRTALSKPENMGEALSRIRKNAAYFRVNYLIVMLATTALTFVMNPASLLVLALLSVGWIYIMFLRTAPLEIGGRTLSDREKLLGMSAISFITIFFLTSVGAVFFSALSLSLAVVAAHGAFREPDNLFVDDGPEQSQSFMGILTGSTPTTANNV